MTDIQTRKLLIFRDKEHIQTVTYVKNHGVWTATHFFSDRYMPFALYAPLSKQKQTLESEGFTWKWI